MGRMDQEGQTMVDESRIHEAARLIGQSDHLVILTGAGVSRESGIPTFREALDGLWERYDPMLLATPQAFQNNPKLVWDWYEYRREMVRAVQPNPGHAALAELEDLLPSVVVVTQNVDDLHQRAGSSDIVTLHGSLMASKCFFDCQGQPTLVDVAALLDYDPDDGPPACPHCGRWVRPAVVWFGEMLPEGALSRAITAVEVADVILVVGTSGLIEPAASLPRLARQAGATLIEVNPRASQITPLVDVWLAGPSGVVLPQVLQAIRAG